MLYTPEKLASKKTFQTWSNVVAFVFQAGLTSDNGSGLNSRRSFSTHIDLQFSMHVLISQTDADAHPGLAYTLGRWSGFFRPSGVADCRKSESQGKTFRRREWSQG